MIGYLVYLLGILALAVLALRGTLRAGRGSEPEPKPVRVERDRDPRLPPR